MIAAYFMLGATESPLYHLPLRYAGVSIENMHKIAIRFLESEYWNVSVYFKMQELFQQVGVCS
jgi:hypothetical protein